MTDTNPPEAPSEPGDRPAAATRDEPSPAPARDRLHLARLYGRSFAVVALLVVLIVLISVNTRTVKVSWAFGSTRTSLVWIILATAVIGWLLGIATGFIFRRRTRRRA
jgi:uncharacterized integral membrane protein